MSGINRGDNCGLHVIYSGTVGAAREAACKVSVACRSWDHVPFWMQPWNEEGGCTSPLHYVGPGASFGNQNWYSEIDGQNSREIEQDPDIPCQCQVVATPELLHCLMQPLLPCFILAGAFL